MTAVSDDITTRLRRDCMSLIADEAANTIDRLRAERDEMQGELRKAETESSMLRVECGVIAAERDEARREVCHVFQTDLFRDAGMFRTANSVALERGWDCFGPNTCKEAQHDLEADTHTG